MTQSSAPAQSTRVFSAPLAWSDLSRPGITIELVAAPAWRALPAALRSRANSVGACWLALSSAMPWRLRQVPLSTVAQLGASSGACSVTVPRVPPVALGISVSWPRFGSACASSADCSAE